MDAEPILADQKCFVASDEQWTKFQNLLEVAPGPLPKLDRLLARESAFDG